MQEGLLEKTDEQLNTIHGLIQDIEFKQVEQRVMQGLQAGNEALKMLNKLMSLEKVEQILDDTQDAAEYQRVRPFELRQKCYLTVVVCFRETKVDN